MKILLLLFALELTFISCKETSSNHHNEEKNGFNQSEIKTNLVDDLIVYKTDNLVIKKLSNSIYIHISFLKTDEYGKVSCNGMLVVRKGEAVVFDSPTDNKSTLELLNFVTRELKSKLLAVIPTHFHQDCVGGIEKLEENDIPVYIFRKTKTILEINGQNFSKPMEDFDESLSLAIGNKKVYAEFYGEGHTVDNIIGVFPDESVIFGGCLLKTMGAGKGYLGDANIENWSETVRKIKLKYPETKIVIPGHGKSGGSELFDYTIELFEIK